MFRVSDRRAKRVTQLAKLVFLQLPRLDSDAGHPGENIPLAAVYLRHALSASSEGRHWQIATLPASVLQGDDAHVLAALNVIKPDVLALTLYLWNIERSLHLARRLRRLWRPVRVVVGGPEVATDNPLLRREGVPFDVAVVGAGESLFPEILAALRTGRRPSLPGVGWRQGAHWRWSGGRRAATPLASLVPPPDAAPDWRPDRRGMAAIETSRGCVWACAFCAYSRQEHGYSWIATDTVMARIRALVARGARELRFTDPTFNAHPRYREILRAMRPLAKVHGLRAFAELHAERITPDIARELYLAGFHEIEVGVQSLDPAVLRRLSRPLDFDRLERGIAALCDAGIKVTLDLMIGLPGQTPAEIANTVAWAMRFKGVTIQALHLLLLPGTALRRRRQSLRLRCQRRPPYRVLSTPAMPARALRATEATVRRMTGQTPDAPTMRFVGRRLPGLFHERVHVYADRLPPRAPGHGNRRAVLIHGDNLYAACGRLVPWIMQACRAEPFLLWQFVLCPSWEEPLDLLDRLIAGLVRLPRLWQDRILVCPDGDRRVARRLYVKLEPGTNYEIHWQQEADALLRRHFH